MGYNFYFRFIKDELVDADKVFIQNVDNVLFQIHFGYIERYSSDIKLQRNRLISHLLRDIKSSLMGCGMQLGKTKKYFEEKLKEIQEEKDPVEREIKEHFYNSAKRFNSMYPNVVEKLIELKFETPTKNLAETEVNLMLYGLLVNSLSKTRKESFQEIKEMVQPLVDVLRKTFSEFDKNEIHKERTFIYHLRLPTGYHDDFYIIEGKDYIKEFRKHEDKYEEEGVDEVIQEIRCLSLTTKHEDDEFIVKDGNLIKKDDDYTVKDGNLLKDTVGSEDEEYEEDDEQLKENNDKFLEICEAMFSAFSNKGNYILLEYRFNKPHIYHKL